MHLTIKEWEDSQQHPPDSPKPQAVLGCVGSCIQTATGRMFDPLHPRAEDVDIRDIAAALSKLCRFTGHVSKFYSVASHCLNASYMVPKAFAAEALLHDASEAYLSDLARPIKLYFPEYKTLETAIERVIAERFNLQYPWPPIIKHIDNVLLRKEAEELMFPCVNNWHLSLPSGPIPGFDVPIVSEHPEDAEIDFLERWGEIQKWRKL